MEARTTGSRAVRSGGLRLGLLIALAILVYATCLGGIYQIVTKPGLGGLLRPVDGGVMIVREGGELFDNGLVDGDIVTAIDGVRVDDATILEIILDQFAIGDRITVSIRSGSTDTNRMVTLVSGYSTAYRYIIAIVGTIFFVIGLYVVLKRPAEPSAVIFHFAMNSAALMIMATTGRHTITPIGLGQAIQAIYDLALAVNALLFVHFTFLFPRPKWIGRRRRLLVPLYLIAGALAAVTAVAFVAGTYPEIEPAWLRIYSSSFFMIQIFYMICSLGAVANFVDSYRTIDDEIERRKLRWTLVGASTGPMMFIFLWLIPDLLGIGRPVSEEVMIILSAITPISFAIAIVRHRLMDIDAILGRSTAYAIVVGTLLIVYAAIVRITAKSVLGTLIDQSEIQALAAVALALLFEPARTRVQRFVDRRFFRVRYNFRQAQRDLSERLQHAIELKRLGEIVVEGLGTLLLTERIAFFILDPERETMTTLAHRGFERKAWKSIAFQAVLRSGREAKPVTLPELIEPGVEFIELDRPIYATHGIALIVSVATMIPGTLALLVLGPKRSGMRFNAEDLDLITTTTIQAGTAVERITLQHDLVIEQAESLRLKELNRLKSFFVSSVSHELKTPLTSIRMFAELLQSGVEIPVEKVTRYAGTIEAESTRLTRLIDNVLDFSKIERGVKEYSFTRIELNSRVESVIESLSYQFATTGFHVAVDLYPEPIELRADGDAVTAAVVNLISNAIKYSGGRREIGVRTARRRNVATVSVSDRGIGISESEKTRIFEAFYRSSDRAASSVAGTGLGLALVHHIVAAHGGSIEVESIPGEGSTFTLLLPLPEPSGSQSSRGAEEVVAADPASYGT